MSIDAIRAINRSVILNWEHKPDRKTNKKIGQQAGKKSRKRTWAIKLEKEEKKKGRRASLFYIGATDTSLFFSLG